MNNNEFVTALKTGGKVFGTLITSNAPSWPEVVASTGLDFVFIDTEHVALDRSEVSHMCHRYRALGLAPMVRISSPDPNEASRALDGGACAIVAPYIEDAEQVRQLAGAIKLKPLKGKRLQQALKDKDSLEPELLKYQEEHQADKALVVNIESVPAMRALDKILTVEGLDAILIGPHDLSCSLGIPEQYRSEKFTNAVNEIISKGLEKQVSVGIHVTYHSGLEQEIEWAGKGVNLIIHSADVIAFRNTMNSEIRRIREAVGSSDTNTNLKNINI